MKCPRCGSSLEGDSRFCKQCGATLQPYTRRIELVSQGASAARSRGVALAEVATARSSEGAVTLPIPAEPVTSAVAPANSSKDDGPGVERLIWQGRPAWCAFYPQWALWVLASVFAAYFIFTRTASGGLLRNALWLIVA